MSESALINPASLAELAFWQEKFRRNAVKGLAVFAQGAWPILEPKRDFVSGWHIDAISEHLEAVVRGEIRNLVINMPPRHMKSLLVSVLFPAWVWLEKPELRFLYASYAQSLSKRDSVKTRRILESPWYRKVFEPDWSLAGDQNEKLRFDNTKQGYRLATSVDGSATGEGGDIIVVDDPHKATEMGDTKRETVLEWWDEAMSSRGNDPKKVAKIIVMQRLHEKDLSGHVLGHGDWDHLCLPAEYEGKKIITSLGWEDPREVKGELLWPEQFGREEIDRLKKDMGSTVAAGQLQQRPAPEGGNIVNPAWWKFYKMLPERFDTMIQSWDLTFDETKNGSFVVGQVWGKLGANKYLVYQYKERCDFTKQLDIVAMTSANYRDTNAKLVEKKANGAALISVLKNKIPGIIPVEPHGSKINRAKAVTPQIESGNVYLPDPSIATWVDEYIAEWSLFPNGENDDQVDATSQALFYLKEQNQDDWTPISLTAASKWR